MTLAVGAIGEDSDGAGIDSNTQWSNLMFSAGAVYVFRLNEGVWSQQAYIKSSIQEYAYRMQAYFGSSLSLSYDGNTLAVGAYGETVGEGAERGAVYVYKYDVDSGWNEDAHIREESSWSFGASLALSSDGDVLAVGAPDGGNADHYGWGSGEVFVYRRGVGSWDEAAYLIEDSAGDFGYSVALSGDGAVLVVGAPSEHSSATGVNGDELNDNAIRSGAAYVFRYNDALAWEREAYVKASNTEEGDRFGAAVALSHDGSRLAVGAPDEDSDAVWINADESNNRSEASGAVYVFGNEEGWAQLGYIKASNSKGQDSFGGALSLSGDGTVLAVGAIGERTDVQGVMRVPADGIADIYNAGAVYIFDLSDGVSDWTQQAYVKSISSSSFLDSFGISIDLSEDGSALAVGATGENGSGAGVGNLSTQNNTLSRSGAVYLY